LWERAALAAVNPTVKPQARGFVVNGKFDLLYRALPARGRDPGTGPPPGGPDRGSTIADRGAVLLAPEGLGYEEELRGRLSRGTSGGGRVIADGVASAIFSGEWAKS